jgi:hypothetical protein
MSSYGLTCPFPVEQFAAFPDLESLDLSDNFDLVVSVVWSANPLVCASSMSVVHLGTPGAPVA